MSNLKYTRPFIFLWWQTASEITFSRPYGSCTKVGLSRASVATAIKEYLPSQSVVFPFFSNFCLAGIYSFVHLSVFLFFSAGRALPCRLPKLRQLHPPVLPIRVQLHHDQGCPAPHCFHWDLRPLLALLMRRLLHVLVQLGVHA